MTIVLSIILFIVGIPFAGNILATLTGPYGLERKWKNTLLDGSIAAAAFAGGYILIA